MPQPPPNPDPAVQKAGSLENIRLADLECGTSIRELLKMAPMTQAQVTEQERIDRMTMKIDVSVWMKACTVK